MDKVFELDQSGTVLKEVLDHSITNATIPNSVTTIGRWAFRWCSSLESVIIPNSVKSIEEYAFWGCESLREVTLPDSIRVIRKEAFKNCKSLRTVFIPESVTEIGEGSFSHCTSLQSIYIPNSVKRIGAFAFSCCDSIRKIRIPNSVTELEGCCFTCCDSLESVYIPESVKKIGSSAFQKCKSLRTINIPPSITEVDGWLLSGCCSLQSIIIPESVTSIGYGAFENCNSLESVTLPNSLKEISSSVFEGCTSLVRINSKIVSPHKIDISGYCFEKIYNQCTLYIPHGTKLKYKLHGKFRQFKKVIEVDDQYFRSLEQQSYNNDAHESSIPIEDIQRNKEDRPYIQTYIPHSIVSVSDMIDFGLEWRDIYMVNYSTQYNKKVSAEVLMYTCWSVWYHCLNANKVLGDQNYVNKFFAHLMAHLQDCDSRFEHVDFFMPLFKNRYQIFKTDIDGLVNSHYPVTKQYLPINTFKAFCLEQLKIVSASSLSSLSFEEEEEMMDFVGKFIAFTNDMQKAIIRTFN